MARPTLYHIPICPFSQRVEILLALEGLDDALDFETVDVTIPRPEWLLAKTRGTTAMPILDLGEDRVIKESLVILRYVIEAFGAERVVRADPWERAIEEMMIVLADPWIGQGYRLLLNQDRGRRDELAAKLLERYASLDEFLRVYGSEEGPYLFEDFGRAELVFTPFFQRFWFNEYYENFELPDEPRFDRVRAWRDACVAHPKAQQVSREEIVKLYYDYAQGAGNGGLLEGRARSSFAFEPSWRERPWPPRDKYGAKATDAELGLLP